MLIPTYRGQQSAGMGDGVDLATTTAVGRSLRGTRWPAAARDFLGSVRRGGHRPGQLLTVGSPQDEPWHLVAHLADSARLRGEAALMPTLVRRAPVPDAPPHLRGGLELVEGAARGTTVLVVARLGVDDELLSRLADARRRGSTVLALTGGHEELTALAHDALVTGHGGPSAAPFDLVSHLVSLDLPAPRWTFRRRPAPALVGAR